MASLIKMFSLELRKKRERERFAHDLGDDKILATDNLAKANMRYQAWW